MNLQKKSGAVLALLVACSPLAGSTVSNNQVRVNRYTLEQAVPTEAQINLMSVIVDIEFSLEVKTVGQAIQQLLTVHGFKLSAVSAGNFGQYVLFMLPLPKVHRQLGPLRLETALRVLGGDGFELHVNPVTREVQYRINEAYDVTVPINDVIKAKKTWEATFGQSRVLEDTASRCSQAPQLQSVGVKKANHYGPTQAGDYLSKIALVMKSKDASVEQAMISLYRANPSAFSENNINFLKRDVYLAIPEPSSVLSIPPEQAKQRVRDHYTQWVSLQQKGITNADAVSTGVNP